MPVLWRRDRFRDAVVLITGASEGIGAACARALGERGAKLALNGRSESKLARVARRDDLIIAKDLTEPDAPSLLIDQTLSHFGRLDILINNAGHGIYWPVAETPDAENRRMFDLNFFAPLALAQAAIPVFRAQGSGTIVNIGSVAGDVPLPWMPLYSASKSALAAVTRALRAELRHEGFHVMLVSPGYVLTGFHQNSFGLAPPPQVVAEKRFAITPEQCARSILRGIERRADHVTTPVWGHALVNLHRLLPRVVEAHLARLNRREEPA